MSLCTARRLLASVCLVALFATGVAAQQTGDDEIARVEASFRGADADGVLDGAATRVEIVLFGQGGMYRRAQAMHVLRDFFRRYPPERVVFAERSSSDDGRMAIGRYWPQDGGAPLTLRLLHRADGDAWALTSIRVEQPSIIRTAGP